MSREYTEDKEVSLKPLSSGRRLLEALLILVALFAVYLMVALVSFNPSDPSWSQTARHEPIHNTAAASAPGWPIRCCSFWRDGVRHSTGDSGTVLDYLPSARSSGLYRLFRRRPAPDRVLALVVTTCGLAALNADDIWYFASGG